MLAARLVRRLSVLTSAPTDLPERQRTLRAAIAWSCDLLNSDEQRLFRALAICVGGCTEKTAACLWEPDGANDALDVASSLLDKNLIHRDATRNDQLRFTMLETVREYAMEARAYIRMTDSADTMACRASAPTGAQQSNTDQQMSFRNC
jgi:predicted ATPase